MNVSSARAVTRPRVPPRLSILVVAGLVGVAVIAGVVIGGTFRSEPAPIVVKPTHVSGAGVRLQLPTEWKPGNASAIEGLERAVWLWNADEGVRAAIAVLPAKSPSLVPASLTAAGKTPETVRLGSGYEVWRYQLASPKGTLYAAPTATGIATVVCLGDGAKACERLASAVVVPKSRRLEPSQRAAFFSGLPPVVSKLEAARAAGVRSLKAATNPTAQGLAADDLARAHETAASSLKPLRIPDDALTGGVIQALAATASAYTALGEAARERIPRPYANAGRAVAGADADLRSRMSKVSAAVESATLTAPPRAQPVSTPAAKPAVTPAATPASTPAAKRDEHPRRDARASTPEAKATSTPAATPASTPEAKATSTPPRRRRARPRRRRRARPPPRPRQRPRARPPPSPSRPPSRPSRRPSTAPARPSRSPRPPPAASTSRVPLLLLFAAVALVLAIRGARRTVQD